MINSRVVFDTNIFISAVLSPTGKPFQCTALAKRGIIQSITCREILAEFKEKLIFKFQYETLRAEYLIEEITGYSELIEINNNLKIINEDPDDDMVMECAILSEANYIITGDRHLLSLGNYEKIKIIKAVEFLSLIFPSQIK